MSNSQTNGDIPTSSVGAVATTLRIIAGLTNERVLVLAIVIICGYLVYGNQQNQASDKAQTLVHCASESKAVRDHYTEINKEKHRADLEREKERSRADLEREQVRLKFDTEERAKDRMAVSLVTTEHSRWRDLLAPVLRKLPAGDEEIKTDPKLVLPVGLVKAYQDAPIQADQIYTDQQVVIKLASNDYKCQKDGVYWYKATGDKHPTIYFACDPPKDCTVAITITGTCKGAIRDGSKRADDVDFLVRVEQCQVKKH